MNRKQFIVLVVLVAVIGGLAFVLSNRNATTWKSPEKAMSGTIFKDFPLNDVTEIVIKDKEGSLTLIKKEERWTVKERGHYPANFTEIGDLLRKVWDLKPVQQPTVGESQLGRLELLEPGKGDKSGTLVEFKGAGGKTLGAVLLGKKHMKEGNAQFGGGSFADGRYLMIPGKLESLALVSESFDDIAPKASEWLAKEFFKIEKIKTVSVSTNGTAAWSIYRETEAGEWKLEGIKEAEKMDVASTGAFNHLLSSAAFSDVLTENMELKNPIKATIETFEGFKYELTLAPTESPEGYHMKLLVNANLAKERMVGKDEKAEDKAKLDKEFTDRSSKLAEKLKQEKQFEGYTYYVNKFTVDTLLKQRSDLIAKTPEKPPE
ncbi:MAG TPA: DUF4340 domain-containing protein [Verrucomicrobiae bacterium]